MWLQLNQIQPNRAHPLCRPLARPRQPNVLPPPAQTKRVLYPGQQHPLQPSAHQWQAALPRWVIHKDHKGQWMDPRGTTTITTSLFSFIHLFEEWNKRTQKCHTLLESTDQNADLLLWEKKCSFSVMFSFKVKAVPSFTSQSLDPVVLTAMRKTRWGLSQTLDGCCCQLWGSLGNYLHETLDESSVGLRLGGLTGIN